MVPPNKNWGEGGTAPRVLVPKISLAQYKNGQNIQSRDLFTNRFTSIALGEIFFYKTFDAVRTALPEARPLTNKTDHVRSFQQKFCHQNTIKRNTQTPTDVFDVTSTHRRLQSAHFLPSDDNYLRGTMKQDRLNNCRLMHCHKSITDTLDTVKIAKRFACANEQRKGHFGNFE